MFKPLMLSLLLWGVHPSTRAETRLQLDPLQVAVALEESPQQFAQALPLRFDARHEGDWRLQGDVLHWHHSITVDTARSLALELATLHLPAGAVLRVGDEVWRGPLRLDGLFTLHQPGARLLLNAHMPRAAAADFMLRVSGVQAAYRDPASPVIRAKSEDACQLNFACAAEGAVRQWGDAVVAITVLNVASCTGTLMNNSAGDGRPYLLTARHCYASTGSTDPARAAASLKMAWNSVAACGTAMQSAWQTGAMVTQGAVHRAEYGDTWLVELNSRPPSSVAVWYAGFDASEQPPTGAVTGIHHGAGLQRQLLSTSVAPRNTRIASFLGGIDLLAWGFAPQRGAASAGSSGSGLFDAEGRVIGTLSTGLACGAEKPQVSYARLSQAWAGDGRSAGSLKPWLDPGGTHTALAGKSSAELVPPAATQPAAASAAASGISSGGDGGGGACSVWCLVFLMLSALKHRQRVHRQAI